MEGILLEGLVNVKQGLESASKDSPSIHNSHCPAVRIEFDPDGRPGLVFRHQMHGHKLFRPGLKSGLTERLYVQQHAQAYVIVIDRGPGGLDINDGRIRGLAVRKDRAMLLTAAELPDAVQPMRVQGYRKEGTTYSENHPVVVPVCSNGYDAR